MTIPDDIMQIAKEVIDRIAKVHVLKGDCVEDVANAISAERERSRQLLSDAEKREARSPFEIVADWHDRQARTFKDMAQDVRAGELGRAKAVEASKHHAGSAAALRLHVLNERRAALERSEG
jgi:hypothetical protein